MNSLPSEIVTEILTRLSFRYVLRSRSVCKTWRSIIDNSKFAAIQFSRATHADTKTTLLFLPKDSPDRPTVYLVELVSEHQHYLFNTTKMEFSCPKHYPEYPRPFVNGLFCFCSETHNGLWKEVCKTYIYNPATKEFVKLPQVTVPPLVPAIALEPTNIVPGFGFDYSTQKYKVVQLFVCQWPVIKTEARVFTLGSKTWRRLQNVPILDCSRGSSPSINNSLHWLAHECVLSFDLGSENFGIIAYPPFPTRVRFLYIMNFGGYLSISDDYCDDHIDLWIMKEYRVKESWTKLIVMKTYAIYWGVQVRFSKILPISLWKNGEILLLCDLRILALYNIESGRYTLLQVDDIPQYRAEGGYCSDGNCSREYRYDVFPYIGNLISLKSL